MVTKRLLFQPKGKIKGGFVAVTADPATGSIHYVAQLILGVLMFSKTFDYSGDYQVDPQLLLSANATTGKRITVGPVTIVVCDPHGPGQVLAAISHSGFPEVRGQALINLKGKYIDIVSITAQGQAFGVPFELYAK